MYRNPPYYKISGASTIEIVTYFLLRLIWKISCFKLKLRWENIEKPHSLILKSGNEVSLEYFLPNKGRDWVFDIALNKTQTLYFVNVKWSFKTVGGISHVIVFVWKLNSLTIYKNSICEGGKIVIILHSLHYICFWILWY